MIANSFDFILAIWHTVALESVLTNGFLNLMFSRFFRHFDKTAIDSTVFDLHQTKLRSKMKSL